MHLDWQVITMNNLSNMIADFLQQNKTESNKSNHNENVKVTTQATDNSKGNRSNLGNQKELNNETILQMLIHASQASGLKAEQLWSFLDGSDVDDFKRGLVDQSELNAFAKSWVRYPETVPVCNTHPFPVIEESKPVKCRYCQYFEEDTIGDGTGAGTCNIKAQASRKGMLWLKSEKLCDHYKPK